MIALPKRWILAAGLAAALSACASSRSLDESFSDLTGNTQLKTVLFSDRQFDYSNIDTTLLEGRLMLTGSMWSEEGRQRLLANAWKAEGVKLVIDEVLIGDKTSFGQGFEDTRIDKALRASLIADEDVTSGRFKFSVSEAVVYVLGAARSKEEMDKTLKIAQSISGVEKVVSHIVISPPGVIKQNP
ncbi:MAG: hypothetical protein DHS20C05_08360 [Hyphococcus sp.]|nr:MAG: hypothetical protein DHS20C05_08360 [Marinicaulis sp.]